MESPSAATELLIGVNRVEGESGRIGTPRVTANTSITSFEQGTYGATETLGTNYLWGAAIATYKAELRLAI